MGILDIFKRKPQKGYEFSDEERENANKVKAFKREMFEKKQELELRTLELKSIKEQLKLDLEIQKLQEELDDLRGEDEEIEIPDGANSEDVMLTTLLSKVLNSQQQQNTPVPISTVQPTNINSDKNGTGVFYTDEQIKNFIASVPKKNLVLLKKLSDEEIREQIIRAVPDANADSVKRALNLIKTSA